MYWYWSEIYTTLYDVKFQNSMMMTMYCIACTLPLPTLPAVICWQRPYHRCQDGYHVDGADCCLIGIVLGVSMKKISPNNNTTQYLQILPSTQLPNDSIVLTLIICGVCSVTLEWIEFGCVHKLPRRIRLHCITAVCRHKLVTKTGLIVHQNDRLSQQ